MSLEGMFQTIVGTIVISILRRENFRTESLSNSFFFFLLVNDRVRNVKKLHSFPRVLPDKGKEVDVTLERFVKIFLLHSEDEQGLKKKWSELFGLINQWTDVCFQDQVVYPRGRPRSGRLWVELLILCFPSNTLGFQLETNKLFCMTWWYRGFDYFLYTCQVTWLRILEESDTIVL